MDAKWKHFGVFLDVEWSVLEAIQKDRVGRTDDCMLEVLGKWVSSQTGTGSLPCTWQTIVEAIKKHDMEPSQKNWHTSTEWICHTITCPIIVTCTTHDIVNCTVIV